MQVDELAQVGNVLRGFVRHAGNVVLEDQQDRLFVFLAGEFLDVDDSSIGDAADAVEPLAALPFDVLRARGLAAQKDVSSE